ncbi:MAG: hypothetical protein LBM64_01585 [Deltaproteobacteria bacterium]|nr:hypothetical protein [Deltaproteobacteria bacterium]
MKQQPSATRKKPSSSGGKPSGLCKFLLTLVGAKLCLLGLMLTNPGLDPAAILPFAGEADPAVQISAPPVAEIPANPAPAPKVETALAEARPEAKNGKYPTRSGHRAPGVAFAAAPSNPPAPLAGQPGSLSLEALTRKQEELARQEQDLKILQAELDSQFQQMQELELRLKIMLKDAEELKDTRYRHLVDVLSNMKARQAADVLSSLDEKIAVRVLAGMRGRQAGEILSLADPARAARLAEALARMQMPLE